MTRFDGPAIRRRADGSIDTAYYTARARQARAAAARDIARAAAASPEGAEAPR
ncbi:MAG: hypothetical protein GVY27_08630, partial [Deinococcus-Thermus bacterium]|nr:hypothetical protein [Deinococcota bacterium]